MPMYNLLEYLDNYFMTSGILWNCGRDEVNGDAKENDDAGKYWMKWITTRQQQVNLLGTRQK